MTPIIEQDYIDVAEKLGCSVADIHAIKEVESSKHGKDGFLPTGEPIILFERHIFRRYTDGRFDHIPDLSNPIPSYKDGSYGKVSEQHAKLARACELDRTVALMSCSWGMFQIMGFNFPHCGFATVQAMVNAMYKGPGEHLKAFANYIIDVGLDDELREQRYDAFFRKYNGPDYVRTGYAAKFAEAKKNFKSKKANYRQV